MTIEKKVDGSNVTLVPVGMLDTANSAAFEAAADEAAEQAVDLTFDFSGVEYISSSGLRILLKSQKKMNTKGKMRLINVNDTVKEVFDLTGFVDILTIE